MSYSYNLIVRQAAVVKRPYSAYEFLNGVFAEGYSEMELEQYLNNNWRSIVYTYRYYIQLCAPFCATDQYGALLAQW